jgi:hypothetical protein
MSDLDQALATVKAAGYVVLKEASYRRAQERQRLAQAQAEWETQQSEHIRAWASDCLDKERLLRDRATYLYGLAAKLGATGDQLRGEDEDAQKTSFLDTLRPIARYDHSLGCWVALPEPDDGS